MIDYSIFPHENIIDNPRDAGASLLPDHFNAMELIQNEDENDALTDFVRGFELLSYQILEKKGATKNKSTRKLQSDSIISLGDVDVTVEDVGKSFI